ncbi:DUF418 domain-containing protein [Nocardiopsis sp. L17-MgMaSL7]|uniref:DUF418 domain-containing protein n=1 Tax=Nocardiopsis sp. L17-MgMaSL7 TaxID=1938893 RepID=UPI000D71A7BE|nr:DUF418 domain-containing protein [Nocardiopsis sp. L17-MgMaSL7]PWV44666.1 putative membrane protein YeiB [Nocardiopsis sp. L17-MgMaSL7]
MTQTPVSTHGVPDTANRPLAPDRRSLAPDLARGIMLLVIALAHTHLFTVFIGGTETTPSVLDRIATAGTVMFVDLRAYPMFAALFGYGLAQIHRRRTEQGREWRWTRALLRRRGFWLVVLGLAHGVLLFPGDILAVYGAVSLLLVGVLRFRDRTLVIMALAWLPLAATAHALVAAEGAVSGLGFPLMPDGLVNEFLFRVTVYPVLIVMMFLSTVVPFLIGVLAARHRVLEKPHEHLRLLRTTALVGVPVAVLGAIPFALTKTGVWTDPTALDMLLVAPLHQVTGYVGGMGYAALIALVAVRTNHSRGRVTVALSALGQRSMTFYLAQSVVWAVLFSSYTLHVQLTSPAVGVGVAVAVWATTVVLADLMRRRGQRGPAETVLRRLTYGPSS